MNAFAHFSVLYIQNNEMSRKKKPWEEKFGKRVDK